MFVRKQLNALKKRLETEPRRFIQVIYGPRQVGKTTLITQYAEQTESPCHFCAADGVSPDLHDWIPNQWERVRLKMKKQNTETYILIIDEIQKIHNWSEAVKKEWDRDTREHRNIKVVLLGSSRLLLQEGLTDSLAGRYETCYMGHWSFEEMHTAFGWNHEEYVWFGGYPGLSSLIQEEERFKRYVNDSLIESSISKDILMLTKIQKPALLHRLFELGCLYSGQILSFTKIAGQLQDAGNTTTLSNYLSLLNTAGLLCGIEKYSPNIIRQRSSSPKFQVFNNALISAQQDFSFSDIRGDPVSWGRWVESAVGAHLLNHSITQGFSLYYWRHKNSEIDFVSVFKDKIIGIEVKSGHRDKAYGIKGFRRIVDPDRVIIINEDGIPWHEFLEINPVEFF